MKRIAIILAAIAVLVGCEKPTPEPVAEDVNITIAYTLDTSVGSDMTRATDAEAFDMFYKKMKSGELVASDYHITFEEVTTGASYEFDGKWDSEDMITIRTGKYRIKGYSKASGDYIQDKVSLIFDEEQEISTSSKSVVLNAIYDCFLLAFAKSDIKVMKLYYTYYGDSSSKTFFSFEDYYYAFANNVLYSNQANRKEQACISGERQNGSVFKIYVGNAILEKGKYYIYNDVDGSFELPKMDAGN